jgi:hypothetical protein
MSTLKVYVNGVGVFGPGLNGWAHSAAVLRGEQSYAAAPLQLPPVEALPPAERRRVGMPIKLAFSSGFEALRQSGADAAQMSTVFTSSSADCDNSHAILETLASTDRAVSPTRFHNAVHNAASGYWSIATACQRPSTSIASRNGSFAAGLLEAATQVCCTDQPCLVLAYDMPYPGPIGKIRHLHSSFGVALVLSHTRTPSTMAQLSLSLCDTAGPSTLQDPGLRTLESGNPAARSLSLLQALAKATWNTVILEYLEASHLKVELSDAAA